MWITLYKLDGTKYGDCQLFYEHSHVIPMVGMDAAIVSQKRAFSYKGEILSVDFRCVKHPVITEEFLTEDAEEFIAQNYEGIWDIL